MKIHVSCAVILLATCCAMHADTIYSNESAWASAVSGSPTIDTYSGLVSATGVLEYGTGVGATTTLQSVTYTAVAPTNAGDYLGIIGQSVAGVNFGVPTLAVGGVPAGPASLLITLPGPVNALGFFFDTDETSDVTIMLSDGLMHTQSAIYPSFGFFGVTSVNPLTSVVISDAGFNTSSPENAVFLSEFAYGPVLASAAPEPSTLALLGAAGFAILVQRRRRRNGR